MKSRPDHPRSRGVYPPPPTDFAAVYGSSPLARGLLLVPFHSHDSIGIIPARAGFTDTDPSSSTRKPDHPRSRGVYGCLCWSGLCALGSSPLARGLRLSVDYVPPMTRIIPARAGFTSWGQRVAALVGDHPRSRGVYSGLAATGILAPGSSPLARGLLRDDGAAACGEGIIPARAGFT